MPYFAAFYFVFYPSSLIQLSKKVFRYYLHISSMFSYSPFNTNFFNKTYNFSTNDSNKTEFLKFSNLAEYFFISHPSSGRKEGNEHERILFFYPSEESITKKTEVTGMSEAVVNFTKGFDDAVHSSSSSSLTADGYEYRYVTSTNYKEVILVVENGEFLIGTSFDRRKCRTNEYFPHLPTICSFVSNVYNAYKLFYGSFFARLEIMVSMKEFKEHLHRFFMPFLQLYRVSRIPLIDLFNGVDFLSLESVNFLEVDCLMTNCMQEFPCIKKAMFFYQERLVQYTVARKDLTQLCAFINHILIASAIQAEVSPLTAAARRNSVHNGFVVKGSMLVDYLGELGMHSFPKLFLRDSNSTQKLLELELFAYRIRSATVCFFIDNTHNLSTNFINDLVDYIDENITAITSKMYNNLPKPVQSDILYQFIYFNPDTLSLRKSFASFVVPNQDTKVEHQVQLPPPNTYRLVYEAYDRFIANSCLFSQVYLKADNDWWIVFKKIERRILVLFISQTVASTIVDIEYYVDNIMKSGLFKILFIP